MKKSIDTKLRFFGFIGLVVGIAVILGFVYSPYINTSEDPIVWSDPIIITSDSDMIAEADWGSGTQGDPWIIFERNINLVGSGYSIAIDISGVTGVFRISDCYITSDGTGTGIFVRNSYWCEVLYTTIENIEDGVLYDEMDKLHVRWSDFISTGSGVSMYNPATITNQLYISENTFEGYRYGIFAQKINQAHILGNEFRNDVFNGEAIKLLTYLSAVSDSITINTNFFNDINFGIEVDDHDQADINNNQFTNVGDIAIFTDGCSSTRMIGNRFNNVYNPIRIENGNNDLIELNTINGGGTGVGGKGILLTGDTSVTITRCNINSFTVGIESHTSFPLEITENTIHSNGRGIWGVAHDSTIEYNTISNNNYGIYIVNYEGTTINNNRFIENQAGIRFTSDIFTVDNIVTLNDFSLNVQGITIDSGIGTNNKIFLNTFLESPCSDIGDSGLWDDGTIGNWWWDYEIKYPSATKSDNTWDTPYLVYGGSVFVYDNYPIVYPDFIAIDITNPAIHVEGDDIRINMYATLETGIISISYYITNDTYTSSTFPLPQSGVENQYWEFRSLPLFAGIYDAIFIILDGNGNEIKMRKEFYITDIPLITFISPVEGWFYNDDFPVEIAISSEIPIQWVFCQIRESDGTQVTSGIYLTYDGVSETWKGTFPLSSYPQLIDGEYQFLARVVNDFEYLTEDTIMINKGSPPASITFLSPLENDYIGIPFLDIRTTCTDLDGINSVTYELWKNDILIGNGFLDHVIDDEYEKLVDITGYEDGEYDLTVKITDSGSEIYAQSIKINIDLKNPIITSIRPVQDEGFSETPIKLSIEVNDEDLDRVTFQIDSGSGFGVETEMTYTGGAGNTHFYDSEPISLSSGYYTVRFTAYTNTPRVSSSILVDFLVDVDDPIVSIDSTGLTGYITSPTTIDVIADASDPTTTIDTVWFELGNASEPVIVTDTLIFDSGITYRFDDLDISTLHDGSYTLEVFVNDSVGNEASDTIIINVDYLDPVILIKPEDTEIVNNVPFNIIAYVLDEDPSDHADYVIKKDSVIILEGDFTDLGGGLFTLFTVSLGSGNYEITVNAYSNTGRSSTSITTFFINFDAPQMDLIYPQENDVVTTDDLGIIVECTDGNGIDSAWATVYNSTWNSGVVSLSETSPDIYENSISLVGKRDGTYQIDVYCTDTFGRESSIIGTSFTIDRLSPIIIPLSIVNDTIVEFNETINWFEILVQVFDEDLDNVIGEVYNSTWTSGVFGLIPTTSNFYYKNLTILNASSGNYTLEITAFSNTGKITIITITFSIEVESIPDEPKTLWELIIEFFISIFEFFIGIIMSILALLGLALVKQRKSKRKRSI